MDKEKRYICYNGSKLADLSLHENGRQEINLAEHEMPGLIECRREYQNSKPFHGARISGSLHATIQTAVLIETLKIMGADIRWSSCNMLSTQDNAVAALVQNKSCCIFAWKNETIEEYWECILDSLKWPTNEGPHIIIDDGGDMTYLLHIGCRIEKLKKENKKLDEFIPQDTVENQVIFTIVTRELSIDKDFWSKLSSNVIGISEETTTGILRAQMMADKNELLFPVINVNDSVTKSKFDNIYGCRHSLPDAILRATDIMLAGKKVLICGYGNVGKGCAASMKNNGSRVYVSEIDPICALQACMEGYSVVTVEQVLDEIDIYVTTTGNKSIITLEHMKKMKNNAILCNIGHFNNEIEVERLLEEPNVSKVEVKPQVDKFTFPEGNSIIILASGRLVNLACATGHPSFVMSCSFTNQIIAQLQLWQNRNNTLYSDKKVFFLPRHLDEKVALLHLKSLGATLTQLTDEQAKYINVNPNGPFKSDHYKY